MAWQHFLTFSATSFRNAQKKGSVGVFGLYIKTVILTHLYYKIKTINQKGPLQKLCPLTFICHLGQVSYGAFGDLSYFGYSAEFFLLDFF